tara:strand:+ start:9545 stop:11083 length:1539 start_codon:yes stop_codon:yes gene_type:complete
MADSTKVVSPPKNEFSIAEMDSILSSESIFSLQNLQENLDVESQAVLDSIQTAAKTDSLNKSHEAALKALIKKYNKPVGEFKDPEVLNTIKDRYSKLKEHTESQSIVYKQLVNYRDNLNSQIEELDNSISTKEDMKGSGWDTFASNAGDYVKLWSMKVERDALESGLLSGADPKSIFGRIQEWRAGKSSPLDEPLLEEEYSGDIPYFPDAAVQSLPFFGMLPGSFYDTMFRTGKEDDPRTFLASNYKKYTDPDSKGYSVYTPNVEGVGSLVEGITGLDLFSEAYVTPAESYHKALRALEAFESKYASELKTLNLLDNLNEKDKTVASSSLVQKFQQKKKNEETLKKKVTSQSPGTGNPLATPVTQVTGLDTLKYNQDITMKLDKIPNVDRTQQDIDLYNKEIASKNLKHMNDFLGTSSMAELEKDPERFRLAVELFGYSNHFTDEDFKKDPLWALENQVRMYSAFANSGVQADKDFWLAQAKEYQEKVDYLRSIGFKRQRRHAGDDGEQSHL